MTTLARRQAGQASIFLALALTVWPIAVRAEQGRNQRASSTGSSLDPSDGTRAELRVLLLIIGPGDDPLSRFGHSSLWIQDLTTPSVTSYNFGTSDPGEEGFWRDVFRAEVTSTYRRSEAQEFQLVRYLREDRTVRVLEMNLSAGQAERLRLLLDRGDPRWKQSRIYEFYRDNCTTAIRDLIDWAAGGQIWDATSAVYADHTLRWHANRFLASTEAMRIPLAILMGQPVDRAITLWEEMFVPELLAERFRQLEVLDDSGARVPLIKAEGLWYESSRPSPTFAASDSWPTFLVVGLAVGALLALVGGATSSWRWWRIAFPLAVAVWLLPLGFFGLLIAALAGLTDQYVAFRNENLLQIHPLLLVLALSVILGASGQAWFREFSRGLANFVAGLALGGLLLKATPWFFQQNFEVLALMVPAHVGLAAGASRWSASNRWFEAATRA